jgi:hypothetical protein
MGMDVCGRRPKSPAGKFFGANNITWRSVYQLIVELCSDLHDPDVLYFMQSNDGHGPTSQKTCNAMADRFEEWLKHRKGKRVRVPGRKGLVDKALVEEWVGFLRHCGGFRVW